MSRFVLVVDDDRRIRSLLRDVLGFSGYEVAVAEDGVEAIEMVAERRPDLIILDVMMPRMDGFTVCRMLRRDEKTADLPIMMLSAKDDDDAVAEGLSAGANKYLTKPMDVGVLLETINKMLAGETAVK